MASTAIIADNVFYAIWNPQPAAHRVRCRTPGQPILGLSGDGGSAGQTASTETWADIEPRYRLRFGSNVALSFGTTLAYPNTADSEAYTLAEEIALPITFINNQGNGLSWQVASVGIRRTIGQLRPGRRRHPRRRRRDQQPRAHLNGLTLTLGDQISYDGNIDVNFDRYGFRHRHRPMDSQRRP